MIPANTAALRQEVYKLRYQVYCVEKGFEDEKNYPDGMEYDQYDAHSCHYLIRHRGTGCYMATTRLILPNKKNPHALFPMEVYCQVENTQSLKNIRRSHLAELSRFCILKQFRRRVNKRRLLVTDNLDESRFSPEEKDSFTHITLALFACAVKMSAEHNIHYWYGIMNPASKRIASALGIQVVDMGPLVDYHGIRLPCAIKIADLLQGVAEKNVDYWNMLTNNGQYYRCFNIDFVTEVHKK
jgi:N-acyl amino acid synthase of PEP-CTERM/exosortase system